MQRHRSIAAGPRRSSSETWGVIIELIAATLEKSPEIGRAEVEAALKRAASIGLALVAGGHLEKDGLVLVADPLHLTITTMSGQAAFEVEENLAPVPGGASAREWMLHFPRSNPHAQLAKSVSASNPYLSDEPAPATREARLVGVEGGIDVNALERRLGKQM